MKEEMAGIEPRQRLYDIYCHYHKHTTKAIGRPYCGLCEEEEIEKIIEKTKCSKCKQSKGDSDGKD